MAIELWALIGKVLEEQIQEGLQVVDEKLWDIVASHVVVNLGQKVQCLKQDPQLRDVVGVLSNHAVCGLL